MDQVIQTPKALEDMGKEQHATYCIHLLLQMIVQFGPQQCPDLMVKVSELLLNIFLKRTQPLDNVAMIKFRKTIEGEIKKLEKSGTFTGDNHSINIQYTALQLCLSAVKGAIYFANPKVSALNMKITALFARETAFSFARSMAMLRTTMTSEFIILNYLQDRPQEDTEVEDNPQIKTFDQMDLKEKLTLVEAPKQGLILPSHYR